MALSDSHFSSVNLRKNPKRFLTMLGVSIEQFDLIFEKLYQFELFNQRRRHPLWREERVEKLVANNAANLREYLCITLLYLRQYHIQDSIATAFGISQGLVSRIINRISQHLEQILPTPARTSEALAQAVSEIAPELRKEYDATLIIDASEQRIERNHDALKQREEYSGKKSAIVENSKLSSP